jgi:DNA-binding NarL/FixJ family response regulator
VPKVLVACTDVTYFDMLLVYFQAYPEFQLCLTPTEGFAVVKQAVEVRPALIVLEMEPEATNLAVAEAFKLLIPQVPVFLIAKGTWEFERAALSIGVDAVFDKDEDFSLVIENAKAAVL